MLKLAKKVNTLKIHTHFEHTDILPSLSLSVYIYIYIFVLDDLFLDILYLLSFSELPFVISFL